MDREEVAKRVAELERQVQNAVAQVNFLSGKKLALEELLEEMQDAEPTDTADDTEEAPPQ